MYAFIYLFMLCLQINAQTELAVRYNDASPLENHHCCVAFRILAKDECNILKHVSDGTFKSIRSSIIRSVSWNVVSLQFRLTKLNH